MTNVEKVIKGIDICLQRFRCGEDCPYYNTEKIGCMEQLREDALELLKEREKTKVVFGRTKDGEFVTECGNCGTHLDKAYSNCPKCKKELDWNSNQI